MTEVNGSRGEQVRDRSGSPVRWSSYLQKKKQLSHAQGVPRQRVELYKCKRQRVYSINEHMKNKLVGLDIHIFTLNRNECNRVAQG